MDIYLKQPTYLFRSMRSLRFIFFDISHNTFSYKISKLGPKNKMFFFIVLL